MSQTEQGQPSVNSLRNSRGRLEAVGERYEPDPPSPSPPPPNAGIAALMEANRPKTTTSAPTPSQQFQQEFMHRSVWKAALLGNLNALALVLAARLIVLVAIGGAIALTWAALGHSDSLSTQVVLAVYTSCAVLVSWIVSRK